MSLLKKSFNVDPAKAGIQVYPEKELT